MSARPKASAAEPAHRRTDILGRSGATQPALIESYRQLADVFHDLLSEQSLDALLERVASTIGELIPHDELAVYEADVDETELRAVYARGAYEVEVLADKPFPFGEGITGWAVANREAVLANRADLDPRVLFVEGTPADPESLIAVPLIARGRVKGALNVYRVGLQEFTEDEFRLAVRFGDAAALALDNAHVRAALELQAMTDALTGLWNHRAFHERLRGELVRASVEHEGVALLMLDLDDFKRVNDIFGHAAGDSVLVELAAHLRESVRQTDFVCRIGGEEFAVILPSADMPLAQALAERILANVAKAEFGPAGRLSVSLGISMGPEHAANPRELVACAEVAMMTAKARGKNRVVVFGDEENERPAAAATTRDSPRPLSQLKMLHHLSSKLNRLMDMAEIGTTIANELRDLIDYHNCRVYIRDGEELVPVAFRGGLSTSNGSGMEVLAIRVGVGVTGHVARTGEPFLTGDAANTDIGHHIPGTERIEESLLAVPLRYGSKVLGVIVISKLGLDQFDAEDVRLIEVLAGHASVALVNAQLYEAQRRETDAAKSLLEFTREISAATALADVARLVAGGAAQLIGSPRGAVWLSDPGSGELVCEAAANDGGDGDSPRHGDRLPATVTVALSGRTLPFAILLRQIVALAGGSLPGGLEERLFATCAVAPLSVGPRSGILTVAIPDLATLDEHRRQVLAGVAGQAQLALANALSFEGMEQTFLSTVESLANALEAKDEYTSSHARWIRDMAVKVGEEMGLEQVVLKRLELGALFHDIGKIGIPAMILNKPGPLTHEERAVIETHPELGERILAPIEQLKDVRPIVRACHERFDGKGYPDGLAGDGIPLEARIIFTCDTFHSMTSTRAYRDALPEVEARRRLVEAAGTQLDPEVVEACLRVLDGSEPA